MRTRRRSKRPLPRAPDLAAAVRVAEVVEEQVRMAEITARQICQHSPLGIKGISLVPVAPVAEVVVALLHAVGWYLVVAGVGIRLPHIRAMERAPMEEVGSRP